MTKQAILELLHDAKTNKDVGLLGMLGVRISTDDIEFENNIPKGLSI